MSKSTTTLPAAFAYNQSAFAWREILIDVVRVGFVRTLMPGPTKLDAQAQWEAGQTIPLMITLMVAGFAAVASQLAGAGGAVSTFWVVTFGVCGGAALYRVMRSYRDVFIKAYVKAGVNAAEAESTYQALYCD